MAWNYLKKELLIIEQASAGALVYLSNGDITEDFRAAATLLLTKKLEEMENVDIKTIDQRVLDPATYAEEILLISAELE